jgi:hypothetical protein
MSKSLATLQTDLAARLARHDEFAGIRILTERAKDFLGDVDRALGGLDADYKTGIFLLIGTPTTTTPNAQIPGPQLGIIATCTISENVLQNTSDNGSNVAASDMALDVLRALCGFQPPQCGKPLQPSNPPIRVVEDPFDPDRLCYLVALTTEMTLQPLRLEGEGTYVKGQ